MKKIDVSVVVTTRNRKYEVSRALRSLKMQTVEPSEVIIVDDGSDDGTHKHIEGQFGSDFIYIYNDESDVHSVGNSRNIGVKRANCKWIAFLDSDDVWDVDYLESLELLINENDNLDVIISNYARHDEDRIAEKKFDSLDLLDNYSDVAASFTLYNKSVFDGVGYFDICEGRATDSLWIINALNCSEAKIINSNIMAGEQWVMSKSLYGDEKRKIVKGDITDNNIISSNKEIENIKNMLNRQKSFYAIMSAWVKLKIEKKSLAEKIRRAGINKVSIYGAGKHGKMLAEDLMQNGISVLSFIDKNENATGLPGIDIVSLEKIDKNSDVIINTVFLEHDRICSELTIYTDIPCIAIDKLIIEDISDFEKLKVCKASLVESIILENDSEDYHKYVKKYANNIDVIRNLSDTSSAILRWYPFRRNSVILELNAGYGCKTGALCDVAKLVICIQDDSRKAELIRKRYKYRKNLAVISSCEIDSVIPKAQRFDYIIAFGCTQIAVERREEETGYIYDISKWSNLLKKDGIILLQEENTFGLSNLCGKRDSNTNIPFDGVSGYVNSKKGYICTRNTLQKKIEAAGFSFCNFFYPVFDHIYPRALYTDDYLPNERFFERYDSYYPDNRTIVVDDRQMLKEIIDNKSFGFYANDFIVEASRQDVLCGICFATISSNRKREKSFAVCVYKDDIVQKRCMFPDTVPYAKKLCGYTAELQKMKVPVLDMKYSENALIMEYIKFPTLQEHICMMVNSDCSMDDIIYIFDILWSHILSSSEYSDHCAFDTSGINPGIILSNAFIELIPLNSFYVNGEVLFFDQEFLMKDYPANYIMMRAIRNSYIFIDGIENIIPLKLLRERYGITDELWNIYLNIDDIWLSEINEFMGILDSYKVSVEQIRENQAKLG